MLRIRTLLATLALLLAATGAAQTHSTIAGAFIDSMYANEIACAELHPGVMETVARHDGYTCALIFDVTADVHAELAMRAVEQHDLRDANPWERYGEGSEFIYWGLGVGNRDMTRSWLVNMLVYPEADKTIVMIVSDPL